MDKKGVKKKSKKNVSKEKVCETIEVEKDGEKEFITSCGEEEIEKGDDKKHLKKYHKIFRNFLIGMGIFIVLLILLWLFLGSLGKYHYKDLDFDVQRVGEVTFYHTEVPFRSDGVEFVFNSYIRNNPEQLEEEILFEGSMKLRKMMVVEVNSEFDCDQDEDIAFGNLNQHLNILGTGVIQDPNATCDGQQRYMFVRFQEGNSTRIEEFSSACYDVYVNDCEILEATERFLIEYLHVKNNEIYF